MVAPRLSLRPGSNAIATGTASSARGYSSYERSLLTQPINRDGQAPENAGVVSSSLEAPPAPAATDPEDRFAGKGELLEADPATAFKAVHEMVLRQEPLAVNRLQLDKHYTATKLGYTGSTLIKVENQDQYRQSFLPGSLDRLTTAAVPNKQADLCQRLTETLLVDPPKLEPEADSDDEVAQRGADLAREYLTQDANESGTDDLTLFAAQIEGATTRASTFNHYWIDPVGGGAIPKQIKAHPLATDAANPLEGVDPATGQPVPTTDYVLRYVTAEGQFTTNPSEAERVWLPRQRIDKLAREHVRLFPETADIHHAQQAVVLYFSTVAEARRRWPDTVGAMGDAEIDALCAWTPPRAAVLLPAAMRGKWRQSRKSPDAAKTDQRILFWYAFYALAEPDYPEGACLWLSGANTGTILGKDTLSATVEMPSGETQDETVTDVRDMDLPLVQIRLLSDVDDRDPMGTAFMARIAGAGEAGAMSAQAMLEAIDIVLHPVRYSIATSPLDADDVESARATGDFAQVTSKDDIPQLEERRDLPGEWSYFQGWLYDQMDSAAGIRPPDSATETKVKSGVALRIEVSEAHKALTRMNSAVHAAWARHGRIKLQQVMKHFTVPQLLRYVGVDGAAKQEWFTGNSFARVGNITIASGTGTMLPWSEKVNLALQLQGAGFIDADEAANIARPAFSKQIGATENPHVQRIERQVTSWMEGPPEGWAVAHDAYLKEVQVHAALVQQMMVADPTVNPAASPQSVPPEPVAPWTPFAMEPMDAEAPIATLRKRRLAALMAKTAFSAQPEPWKQVVRDAYQQCVDALRAAAPVAPPVAGAPVVDPNATGPSAT